VLSNKIITQEVQSRSEIRSVIVIVQKKQENIHKQ